MLRWRGNGTQRLARLWRGSDGRLGGRRLRGGRWCQWRWRDRFCRRRHDGGRGRRRGSRGLHGRRGNGSWGDDRRRRGGRRRNRRSGLYGNRSGRRSRRRRRGCRLAQRCPCGGIFGFLIGPCLRFRVRFGLSLSLDCGANFYRNVSGDRTGVRLFFSYAETGQKVNDCFRFDLEFAGQLVNSDLIDISHALLGVRLFLLLHTALRF